MGKPAPKGKKTIIVTKGGAKAELKLEVYKADLLSTRFPQAIRMTLIYACVSTPKVRESYALLPKRPRGESVAEMLSGNIVFPQGMHG